MVTPKYGDRQLCPRGAKTAPWDREACHHIFFECIREESDALIVRIQSAPSLTLGLWLWMTETKLSSPTGENLFIALFVQRNDTLRAEAGGGGMTGGLGHLVVQACVG
jgi:hypothetical protein